MLLNAQQVACELGYLTLPELSVQAQRTLTTLSLIPKVRGHLLNWYDTHTLEPLTPRFVSSVDSGNLVASLWTLQQGLLSRIKQPLMQRSLAQGVLDHLRALAELKGVTKRQLSRCEQALETKDWLPAMLALCEDEMVTQPAPGKSDQADEIQWLQEQLRARLTGTQRLVRSYSPWELPEFASVRNEIKVAPDLEDSPSLRQLPIFIDDLHVRLEKAIPSMSRGDRGVYEELLAMLPEARSNAERLIEALRSTADEAAKLADAMDFTVLLSPRRKLMSVGFNVADSEARARVL